MRTTIDLPDELFRRVKARAALDGLTLKTLLTRYVEQGLRGPGQAPDAEARPRRGPLPVVRAATGDPLPAFTHAELNEILAREDAGLDDED